MSCVVTRLAHELVDIDSRNGGYETMIVVRWCCHCGGVVIDRDVDGRTAPGAEMRMRFPQLAIDAAKPG